MKDYMQFVCPTSNSNLGMQNSQLNYDSLHEVAYFLYPENEQDALNCNATGWYTPLLSECTPALPTLPNIPGDSHFV